MSWLSAEAPAAIPLQANRSQRFVAKPAPGPPLAAVGRAVQRRITGPLATGCW